MSISEYPSTVVLPMIEKPYPSILTFLTGRFPGIEAGVWEARINAGKVTREDGTPIGLDMAYEPFKRLRYFREVEREPVIPFAEKILFCNDDLLVACKPHFLPVIPGGPHVNECLLHRLKKRTGNTALSPINRIDRETAGLVLFSMNPKTRGRYQELFMTGEVTKTYEAVAHYPGGRELGVSRVDAWIVENRIVKGEPWFRMKLAPGPVNAVSKIFLLGSKGNKARFRLCPVTGKKHQLRLHLSGLGFPILNDRCYPDLLPEVDKGFKDPLQLLARKIQFRDPMTGLLVAYESPRRLGLENLI